MLQICTKILLKDKACFIMFNYYIRTKNKIKEIQHITCEAFNIKTYRVRADQAVHQTLIHLFGFMFLIKTLTYTPSSLHCNITDPLLPPSELNSHLFFIRSIA